MRDMGKAAIDVTVEEGQSADVTYRAPLLVFLAGRISTT